MFKKFVAISLLLFSSQVSASGAGLTIQSVFYCSSDFSMLMSNKKAANVFPREPILWCGNSNVKPITIFSFVN